MKYFFRKISQFEEKPKLEKYFKSYFVQTKIQPIKFLLLIKKRKNIPLLYDVKTSRKHLLQIEHTKLIVYRIRTKLLANLRSFQCKKIYTSLLAIS